MNQLNLAVNLNQGLKMLLYFQIWCKRVWSGVKRTLERSGAAEWVNVKSDAPLGSRLNGELV